MKRKEMVRGRHGGTGKYLSEGHVTGAGEGQVQSVRRGAPHVPDASSGKLIDADGFHSARVRSWTRSAPILDCFFLGL